MNDVLYETTAHGGSRQSKQNDNVPSAAPSLAPLTRRTKNQISRSEDGGPTLIP